MRVSYRPAPRVQGKVTITMTDSEGYRLAAVVQALLDSGYKEMVSKEGLAFAELLVAQLRSTLP